MTGTPKRTASDARASSRRMARTADPPPAAGNTSPQAESDPRSHPPEGTPAPARDTQRAVSAPLAGQDGRDAWKAAESAHNAAQRRGRFTRAAKRTGPGMIRKRPPDDAA